MIIKYHRVYKIYQDICIKQYNANAKKIASQWLQICDPLGPLQQTHTHLAPGRLEVPVSIGTPTNAASSPSAVSWCGSLAMVGIPDTRATNSALTGTLKRLPELFLFGLTHGPRLSLHMDEVCRGGKEKYLEEEMAARLKFKFLQTENILACNVELCQLMLEGVNELTLRLLSLPKSSKYLVSYGTAEKGKEASRGFNIKLNRLVYAVVLNTTPCDHLGSGYSGGIIIDCIC